MSLPGVRANNFNSLAPGIYDCNFKNVIISDHMLQIKFMATSCETTLVWMPQ